MTLGTFCITITMYHVNKMFPINKQTNSHVCVRMIYPIAISSRFLYVRLPKTIYCFIHFPNKYQILFITQSQYSHLIHPAKWINKQFELSSCECAYFPTTIKNRQKMIISIKKIRKQLMRETCEVNFDVLILAYRMISYPFSIFCLVWNFFYCIFVPMREEKTIPGMWCAPLSWHNKHNTAPAYHSNNIQLHANKTL